MRKKGAGRAGKGFTLFISNEHMNDIKIIESQKNSGLLIDGMTETLKYEIKKARRWISSRYAPTAASLIAPMVSSLMQPVTSLLINYIRGKGKEKES